MLLLFLWKEKRGWIYTFSLGDGDEVDRRRCGWPKGGGSMMLGAGKKWYSVSFAFLCWFDDDTWKPLYDIFSSSCLLPRPCLCILLYLLLLVASLTCMFWWWIWLLVSNLECWCVWFVVLEYACPNDEHSSEGGCFLTFELPSLMPLNAFVCLNW